MSENESNDLGAFLAGFVIGGLVGAATALIMAPQSGQDTRSQLATKSSELRTVGGERIHQYRDTASTLVADTRTRAEETTSSLQEQVRIVLDTGKEKVLSTTEQQTDEPAEATEAEVDEMADSDEGETTETDA